MITIVNHVLAIAGWQEILAEQLCYFRHFGIAYDNWYCNLAGDRADRKAMVNLGSRLGIEFTDIEMNHPAKYEMPALDLVKKHAREHVYYFHTKGVTAPADPERRNHRWLMQHYTMRGWRDCVRALASHDVAGVNWRGDLTAIPHFSGNFWWANAAWIASLPPIWDYCRRFRTDPVLKVHHPRCAAEFWLGSTPGTVNAKSFHCENVEFLFGGDDYLANLPSWTHRPEELLEEMSSLGFGNAAQDSAMSHSPRSLPSKFLAKCQALAHTTAEYWFLR